MMIAPVLAAIRTNSAFFGLQFTNREAQQKQVRYSQGPRRGTV
jgi:hypothetical protein